MSHQTDISHLSFFSSFFWNKLKTNKCEARETSSSSQENAHATIGALHNYTSLDKQQMNQIWLHLFFLGKKNELVGSEATKIQRNQPVIASHYRRHTQYFLEIPYDILQLSKDRLIPLIGCHRVRKRGRNKHRFWWLNREFIFQEGLVVQIQSRMYSFQSLIFPSLLHAFPSSTLIYRSCPQHMSGNV